MYAETNPRKRRCKPSDRFQPRKNASNSWEDIRPKLELIQHDGSLAHAIFEATQLPDLLIGFGAWYLLQAATEEKEKFIKAVDASFSGGAASPLVVHPSDRKTTPHTPGRVIKPQSVRPTLAAQVTLPATEPHTPGLVSHDVSDPTLKELKYTLDEPLTDQLAEEIGAEWWNVSGGRDPNPEEVHVVDANGNYFSGQEASDMLYTYDVAYPVELTLRESTPSQDAEQPLIELPEEMASEHGYAEATQAEVANPPMNLYSITFQPGPLFMALDEGVVYGMGAGPAMQAGVQQGWRINAVDGKPYSEDVLRSACAGTMPFEIEFECAEQEDNPFLPPVVANNVSSSTSSSANSKLKSQTLGAMLKVNGVVAALTGRMSHYNPQNEAHKKQLSQAIAAVEHALRDNRSKLVSSAMQTTLLGDAVKTCNKAEEILQRALVLSAS